jgi:hypothetical protein
MKTQIDDGSIIKRLSAGFIDGLILYTLIALCNTVLTFLAPLIYISYTLFFWFAYSATPGKLILKIKIADSKTFQKPTKWQFVKRLLVQHGAYILPLFIDYFLSEGATLEILSSVFGILSLVLPIINISCFLFTKQEQTLHDIIAGTVVIRSDESQIIQ